MTSPPTISKHPAPDNHSASSNSPSNMSSQKIPSQQHNNQEQPQRSRNARAQARHRAKRKAYIEQLEETVTKLQAALHLTPEQVAAMPPAHMRIRELESENYALKRENDDLRMQLGRVHGNGISVNNHAYGHGGHGGHGPQSGGHGAHGAHNGHSGHVTPTPAPPSLHNNHSHPPPHHGHQHTGPQCCRHDSNPSPVDGIAMGLNSAILDREKKRRRHSGEVDGVYLTPGGTPPLAHSGSTRLPPPPLSLPHPTHPSPISQPNYGSHSLITPISNTANSSNGTAGSMMPINSPVFPVPGTPSTSSSNSTTPSFPQGTSLPPVEGLRKTHRTGSFESLESGRGSAGAQGIHNNGMQLPPPVPTYGTQVLPQPYSQNGPYEVKTEEDYHQQHHLSSNLSTSGALSVMHSYNNGGPPGSGEGAWNTSATHSNGHQQQQHGHHHAQQQHQQHHPHAHPHAYAQQENSRSSAFATNRP